MVYFFPGKPSRNPTHPDYVTSLFLHTPGSDLRSNRELGRYDRMKDSKRRRLITTDEFRRPGFPDTLCPYSSNDVDSGNQSFAEDLL